MTTRRRSSRWKLGAFSLVLLLFAGGLALHRPVTASLPDGTTFELVSLDVAPTNVVVRATFLGRVAERWIPANGWKVGKFEMQRPQRLTFHHRGLSDLLVAAIKLQPGSPREQDLLLPASDRPLRVQIIGDDGYGYVDDYAIFRKHADGVFAHVVTPRFPRDSAHLRFRLEEHHSDSVTGWRELVTLRVANPKPASPQPWSVEPSQRISLGDDLELETGTLTISTNAARRADLWVNQAGLAARFRFRGQRDGNWSLQDAVIRDALGNVDATGLHASPSDDWYWYAIERPLDPQVPWRFETHVARVSGFPETNLFNIKVRFGDSLSTNLGGVAALLRFTGADVFEVQLTERPRDRRLNLVSVRLADGKSFGPEVNASNQHRFSKSLIDAATNAPAAQRAGAPHEVEATIAIHPNYPVQFTLQPEFDAVMPTSSPR